MRHIERRDLIRLGLGASAAAGASLLLPANASASYAWSYPYPRVASNAGTYRMGASPTTSWIDDALAVACYRGSIKNIQRRLNELFHLGLACDGIIGARTDDGIRRAQRSLGGLAVDGVVGPGTARQMGLQWTSNVD